MSEVTLKPEQLGTNHPAVTKSGNWTARAKRLLRNRTVRSRGPKIPFNGRSRPVRNTELFYRIADEIEVFPEEYKQGEWFTPRDAAPCGTAFCIAGHSAHLTGWVPAKTSGGQRDWTFLSPSVLHLGEVFTCSSVGRHELGLTWNESSILFDGMWIPAEGLSVPDALRALGDGAPIQEVTDNCGEGDSGGRILIHGYDESDLPTPGRIRVSGKKPVYS